MIRFLLRTTAIGLGLIAWGVTLYLGVIAAGFRP